MKPLRCQWFGCKDAADQFLQTWTDTLICRCSHHAVTQVDERKDVREISAEEARVLEVQGS